VHIISQPRVDLTHNVFIPGRHQRVHSKVFLATQTRTLFPMILLVILGDYLNPVPNSCPVGGKVAEITIIAFVYQVKHL